MGRKKGKRKKKKNIKEVPELDPDSADTDVAHISKLRNGGGGLGEGEPEPPLDDEEETRL